MKETFECFDSENKDGKISRDEAVNHWAGKFGKLSAKEFFDQLDVNKDGDIDYDEFEKFFQAVRKSGHDEEEIIEVLISIKNGESWVGFANLPKQYTKN
jgi:Ca2+-binding EF-hand superfamily protein